jgi:hypothetical protein
MRESDAFPGYQGVVTTADVVIEMDAQPLGLDDVVLANSAQ